MNTKDAMITMRLLSKNIKINLRTIADFQTKAIEWEKLSYANIPIDGNTKQPIEYDSLIEVLQNLTSETIAMSETVQALNDVLHDLIPENQLTFYAK